jgi:hypothetical protein
LTATSCGHLNVITGDHAADRQRDLRRNFLQARSTGSEQHYNGDFSVEQILLVFQILVGGD